MAESDRRGGAAPAAATTEGGLFRQVFVDAGIVREAARRLVERAGPMDTEELARLITDLREGIGRLADRMVASDGFAADGGPDASVAEVDLRDDGQVSPARRRLFRRVMPLN